MFDQKFRIKLIQLAKDNPELRKEFLPLIQESAYVMDVNDKQITQDVLRVLKANRDQTTRKDEDDLTKALTRSFAGRDLSVRDPRAFAQDLLYQVNIQVQYSTADPNKTRDILDRYVIPSSRISDFRNKLIRLAHANPELRGDLLPLIKAAAVRLSS